MSERDGRDSIEDLMRDLGTLRGGSHGIYKPAVEVTFYEHDECASVRVGRCKGMEEVVYTNSFMGDDCLRRALVDALENLKATGAE